MLFDFANICCISLSVATACIFGLLFHLNGIVFIGNSNNLSGSFLPEKHYEIVIGILSARENFSQRSVIRKYLAAQIKAGNYSIVYKFIIGNSPCMIHPEIRASKYTCESLTISNSSTKLFSYSLKSYHLQDRFEAFYEKIGLDFYLHKDIKIWKLGIVATIQFPTFAKVTLYNVSSSQPLASVLFTIFSRGELVDGFYYKQISPITLTRESMYSIVIDDFSTDNEKKIFIPEDICSVNNNNSSILHRNGYRKGHIDDDFPKYFMSHLNISCAIPSASFQYATILDSNFNKSLSDFEYLNKSWSDLMRSQTGTLEEESRNFSDILFVDVTDVYRNLPRKIIHFCKSLKNIDFEFLLKTDDDCFINILAVKKKLTHVLKRNKRSIFAGNFRIDFGVNKIGKWAEFEYNSVTYPPFPCGSGYVISSNLVQWIALNSNYLKQYQGEDVSIAIWLSAIHHHKVQISNFYCTNEKFSNTALSIPQNDVTQLELKYQALEI